MKVRRCIGTRRATRCIGKRRAERCAAGLSCHCASQSWSVRRSIVGLQHYEPCSAPACIEAGTGGAFYDYEIDADFNRSSLIRICGSRVDVKIIGVGNLIGHACVGSEDQGELTPRLEIGPLYLFEETQILCPSGDPADGWSVYVKGVLKVWDGETFSVLSLVRGLVYGANASGHGELPGTVVMEVEGSCNAVNSGDATATLEITCDAEPCQVFAWVRVSACINCELYAFDPPKVIDLSDSVPGETDWIPAEEGLGCNTDCCLTRWVENVELITTQVGDYFPGSVEMPTIEPPGGGEEGPYDVTAEQFGTCCARCCRWGYGPEGTSSSPGDGCCLATGDKLAFGGIIQIIDDPVVPPESPILTGYSRADIEAIQAGLGGFEYQYTCPEEGTGTWTRTAPETLATYTPSIGFHPTPTPIVLVPDDEGSILEYQFFPRFFIYHCTGEAEGSTLAPGAEPPPFGDDGGIYIEVTESGGGTSVIKVVCTLVATWLKTCKCREDGAGGCIKLSAPGYYVETTILDESGTLSDPVLSDIGELGCTTTGEWLTPTGQPCVRRYYEPGCPPADIAFGEFFPAPALTPEDLEACFASDPGDL